MGWSWDELDRLPAHLYGELVGFLNRTDEPEDP
jgi:hypothetical protein